MKNLYQFKTLDWSAFNEGKKYIVVEDEDLVDNKNGNAYLGRKLTLSIVEDKTVYSPLKSGKPVKDNFSEMFTVKVLGEDSGYLRRAGIKLRATVVRVTDVTNVRIWSSSAGSFDDTLSLEGRVIPDGPAQGAKPEGK